MSTRLSNPLQPAVVGSVIGGFVFAALTYAYTGSVGETVVMTLPWMVWMAGWAAYQTFYRPRALAVAAGKGRAWESVDHGCQMTVQATASEAREAVLSCLRAQCELEVLESGGDALVVSLLRAPGHRDLVTALFTPQEGGVGIRLTSRPANPTSLHQGPRNYETVHAVADRLVEQFDVEARKSGVSRIPQRQAEATRT